MSKDDQIVEMFVFLLLCLDTTNSKEGWGASPATLFPSKPNRGEKEKLTKEDECLQESVVSS